MIIIFSKLMFILALESKSTTTIQYHPPAHLLVPQFASLYFRADISFSAFFFNMDLLALFFKLAISILIIFTNIFHCDLFVMRITL